MQKRRPKPHALRCDKCNKPFKAGEPCYQVRSGVIGEDGDFDRQDLVSQSFHIDCICCLE